MLPEGAATDVSSNLFQLSRQVAEQYVAPWGQCLRLVLPPAPKPRAQVSHYELTEQGRAALAAREPCSVKARALLTRLREKPSGLRRSSRSLGPGDLLHDLKVSRVGGGGPDLPSDLGSALSLDHPDKRTRSIPASRHRSFLTPSMSWAEPLFEALRGQGPTRVLVQAIWTDRLRLLQQTVRLVLDRGQTVLIIVGEAERAQWVAGLIRDDETGIYPVCFHSGLSDQLKAETVGSDSSAGRSRGRGDPVGHLSPTDCNRSDLGRGRRRCSAQRTTRTTLPCSGRGLVESAG